MNITLKIACSNSQLQENLAYSCNMDFGNTKPADQVPGRSDQRASERGSEVLAGAKCEGISQNQDSSKPSISSLTPSVKKLEKNN